MQALHFLLCLCSLSINECLILECKLYILHALFSKILDIVVKKKIFNLQNLKKNMDYIVIDYLQTLIVQHTSLPKEFQNDFIYFHPVLKELNKL